MLLGYMFQNNKAAYAQVLATNAEFHRANRILARIEQLPQYTNNKPKFIAFIGKRTSLKLFRNKPFLQSTGISSELMISQSRFEKMLKLLRVNNVHRITSKNDERYKLAIEYAKTHEPWPHPSSIAYLDGIIVVVLDNRNI
jgi:hypothetical protein